LPANAHSISLSTGIPRETVRRKLAALVAQGWLEDNGRSEYFVTSAPGNHFAPMTHELLLLLLGTADDLRSLLETPPAQATTARQKRG
jgi:DNA-binding FadR family transcriptional regulator